MRDMVVLLVILGVMITSGYLFKVQVMSTAEYIENIKQKGDKNEVINSLIVTQ